MSRLHRLSWRLPAPDPGQIKTVRRALDAGQFEQARQRLAALRKSFPGFRPLLGLAWEIEDRSGEPMLAAARAHAWHREVPGSRAALEGLCKSTLAAGLVAAHARANRRLLALDGHAWPVPEPQIDTALGALTLEQAEAIDLSRMHMAVDDADAAVAVLQGVDHPSARNNLALALADRGEFAQALSLTEANWQVLPANLHALGLLVRLRCRAEGLERCLGFVAPLHHTQALRAEDAIAQVAALHFLGEARAAREAWDAATGAPFWKVASTRQREIFDSLRNPDAGLPAGHDLWFSSPWFNAMLAISRDSRAGQAGAAQRWDAHLDACDAHTDYLLRAAELGDEVVRHLALSVLKRRAQHTDASALAALRRLLTRPCGTDQVRAGLLRWLTDQNLVGQDEPVEVWLQGRLINAQSRGVHITTEPPASPFAPSGAALQRRVHAAISRHALDEALELAQQLMQMHPDEPTALVNVATIQEERGHPIGECIGYYRQAHALAPDHLFARFGLARCLALQGQLEEARALFNGYLDRSHWHVSDYNCFLLAQHALALASGQHESARNMKATMDDLRHRFPA